jgi:large repetitive protein
VWSDPRPPFTFNTKKIFGGRVTAEGTTIDGDGFQIGNGERDEFMASVASLAGQYLVVWADLRILSNTWDLYGARINSSGVVLDTANIPISVAPKIQWEPSVAANETEYLVVWEEWRNNVGTPRVNADISGARITTNGVVLDVPSIAICTNAPADQKTPDVTGFGEDFFVLWADYRLSTSNDYSADIFGARVTSTGMVMDLSGFAVNTNIFTQITPVVAYSANGKLLSISQGTRDGALRMAGNLISFNSPPSALPQLLSVDEDGSLNLTLSGTDPDGDNLTFVIVTPPTNGVLSGVIPNLVYTPFGNYFGADALLFAATDGQATSAPVAITITVRPINDAPVVNSATVVVNEDEGTPIALLAFDVDGDPLSFSVTAPAHGTLTGNASNLTYSPNRDYFGTDSFAVRVSDGHVESAPALISLNVLPINDAPVAVATISPLTLLTPGQTNLVIISPNNTNTVVVLDGSLSSDIDNDPLHYSWFVESATEPFATGVRVTNLVAVGSHKIALRVDDGNLSAETTIDFDVITLSEAVAQLLLFVEESSLDRTRKRPLSATLKAAMAGFERGEFHSAMNQLRALQNKTRAQIEPIDPLVAREIISRAEAILDIVSPSPQGRGPG